jgi:hypothetical protein
MYPHLRGPTRIKFKFEFKSLDVRRYQPPPEPCLSSEVGALPYRRVAPAVAPLHQPPASRAPSAGCAPMASAPRLPRQLRQWRPARADYETIRSSTILTTGGSADNTNFPSDEWTMQSTRFWSRAGASCGRPAHTRVPQSDEKRSEGVFLADDDKFAISFQAWEQ